MGKSLLLRDYLGPGKRFAKVLAACGAKVVATGRRVDRLEALAEEIRADGGICEPIAIDMTSRDSIRAALIEAEARLGTVQILINNAGIPDAERAIKCLMSLLMPCLIPI